MVALGRGADVDLFHPGIRLSCWGASNCALTTSTVTSRRILRPEFEVCVVSVHFEFGGVEVLNLHGLVTTGYVRIGQARTGTEG